MLFIYHYYCTNAESMSSEKAGVCLFRRGLWIAQPLHEMHVTIELQFMTLAVHVCVLKVGLMVYSIYIHHRHQNGEIHQYTVDKAIDASFLLSSFAHLCSSS